MKKILLIATGGTIASAPQNGSLAPSFDAAKLLSYLPDLHRPCQIDGISLMQVDSTNMTPARIQKIAECIGEQLDEYDGFVVSHGTDTLAYTASALTFMLTGLQKPVIVVGSQMSIDAQYTDAKQNIHDAFAFAMENIAGVFVVFDGKLMLGTRTTKLKTRSIDAFSSINFPTLATIKFGKIDYNPELSYIGFDKKLLPDPAASFELRSALCEDVFILKLFPGLKPAIFDFIRLHYRGVVIESFGIGGIPNKDPDYVAEVEKLIAAGLQVVITTQCLEEGVDLSIYQVSQSLNRLPIIYAGDMTTEAVTMKLMWALANLQDASQMKCFIESNN